MATVTKVTRRVGGKAYEYHAVRFTVYLKRAASTAP
jgi:hypothetical protein